LKQIRVDGALAGACIQMQNQKIEKIAEALYEPGMPYHNFGHVRDVLEESEKLLGRCREEGITVDDAVVYYALLFHDTGYHEDHIALGFQSKEAYSADLAEQKLRGNGIDQDIIGKIKTAILATHVDAACQTNEDKIVRLADLSQLAADYATFKRNTLNLKKELEIISNKEVSWSDWKEMAVDRISLFLREEMNVTSDYYDEGGGSVFMKNTKANLDALMSDDTEIQ
jgi:predicted metal-dependent HD superfamily phosphohydrolase